jgi:formylglycine-generating enzyme required for sulfatase activity
MTRIPLLIVVAALLGFVAWGAWSLLAQGGASEEDLHPPAYALRAASPAEVQSRLPDWAQYVEGSGLDPASGLPSPVRDARTGLAWVLLPAGEVALGTARGRGYKNETRRPERPLLELETPRYITRTEVSWGAYRRFLDEKGLSAEWLPLPAAYPDEYPVVGVTRHEAQAFAEWAGGALPTEVEYEFAAKGEMPDLRFPWGSDRDPGDACIARPLEALWENAEVPLLVAALAPCGSSERDVSWCGVRDLAGSVAEWTEGWYSSARAPGGSSRLSLMGLVRGGSWATSLGAGRCTNRSPLAPEARLDSVGFRVVRQP